MSYSTLFISVVKYLFYGFNRTLIDPRESPSSHQVRDPPCRVPGGEPSHPSRSPYRSSNPRYFFSNCCLPSLGIHGWVITRLFNSSFLRSLLNSSGFEKSSRASSMVSGSPRTKSNTFSSSIGHEFGSARMKKATARLVSRKGFHENGFHPEIEVDGTKTIGGNFTHFQSLVLSSCTQTPEHSRRSLLAPNRSNSGLESHHSCYLLPSKSERKNVIVGQVSDVSDIKSCVGTGRWILVKLRQHLVLLDFPAIPKSPVVRGDLNIGLDYQTDASL